jgi:hypothetical protein
MIVSSIVDQMLCRSIKMLDRNEAGALSVVVGWLGLALKARRPDRNAASDLLVQKRTLADRRKGEEPRHAEFHGTHGVVASRID